MYSTYNNDNNYVIYNKIVKVFDYAINYNDNCQYQSIEKNTIIIITIAFISKNFNYLSKLLNYSLANNVNDCIKIVFLLVIIMSLISIIKLSIVINIDSICANQYFANYAHYSLCSIALICINQKISERII